MQHNVVVSPICMLVFCVQSLFYLVVHSVQTSDAVVVLKRDSLLLYLICVNI